MDKSTATYTLHLHELLSHGNPCMKLLAHSFCTDVNDVKDVKLCNFTH